MGFSRNKVQAGRDLGLCALAAFFLWTFGALAQDLTFDRWSYQHPGDLLHDEGVHTAGVILEDLSFAVMILDADGEGAAVAAMIPGDTFEDTVKSILTMTDGTTRTLTITGDTLTRERPKREGVLNYSFFITADDIELFKAARSWALETETQKVSYPLKGSRRAIIAAQAAQSLSAAGEAAQTKWTAACDAQAGHPFDTQATAAGVDWDALAAETAITACRNAYVSGAAIPRVKYQLGRAYDRAEDRRAIELLTQAALIAHYPIAFAHLGRLYQSGAYGTPDVKAALGLYAQGAQLGDVVSSFAYGRALLATDSDDDKALGRTLVSEAAAKEYPPAQRAYGLGLLNGTFGDADPKSAIPVLEQAAKAGDGEAAFALAELYVDDAVLPADPRLYLDFLKRAAAAGHAKAQEALAYD